MPWHLTQKAFARTCPQKHTGWRQKKERWLWPGCQEPTAAPATSVALEAGVLFRRGKSVFAQAYLRLCPPLPSPFSEKLNCQSQVKPSIFRSKMSPTGPRPRQVPFLLNLSICLLWLGARICSDVSNGDIDEYTAKRLSRGFG